MKEIVILHNDLFERTIKPISENSFLIEGKSTYLKWSLNEPPKSVEFQNGPRLTVGNNFYKKGKILKIEKAESSCSSNKAVLITVES